MSADRWSDCPKCKSEENFREDFEISGPLGDGIEVSYFGACENCGFYVNFEHKHPFQVPK